jgi:hypothetical protein
MYSSGFRAHPHIPPFFAQNLRSNVSKAKDLRPKISYFFCYFGGAPTPLLFEISESAIDVHSHITVYREILTIAEAHCKVPEVPTRVMAAKLNLRPPCTGKYFGGNFKLYEVGWVGLFCIDWAFLMQKSKYLFKNSKLLTVRYGPTPGTQQNILYRIAIADFC